MTDKKEITGLTVIKDGPLQVRGNFVLTNAEGHEIKTGREVFFCRCGRSQNKPFCDGTHKQVKFRG